MNSNTHREKFGSSFGVLATAVGSAVGLGNVWRFPYIAGENGGGAFLIIYIAFVLLLGIPVMLSEFVIGRKSQKNIFGAFRTLAPGKPWFTIGIMGVVAAFLILSFYSVVAGWTIEYLYLAASNSLTGKTPQALQDIFSASSADSWYSIISLIVFMLATALIVKTGIGKGIEKYSKLLMPMLLAIIILLAIRSLTLEGASEGIRFLFKPDFSKVTTGVVLQALGQSFFSLSLGMGVMATFGSYISKKESLGRTAVLVSLSDTFIAILAGVAIFPAVFAFGIAPTEGTKLVFITLPNIFNQMLGGYFFSVIFFILLLIAALTSSISLLEVVVAYFSEELHTSRPKATWIASGAISALGLACIKSTKIFSLFDSFSSNILLPLGGLCIVLFVGWYMKKQLVKQELEENGKPALYFRAFYIIIRYVAPFAILFVFLNQLGIIA